MCTIDTDMRCGRNGLSGIVTNHMKFNALAPDTIYIFLTSAATRLSCYFLKKTAIAYIIKDYQAAPTHCLILTAAVQ
jgi:hypothetical protein